MGRRFIDKEMIFGKKRKNQEKEAWESLNKSLDLCTEKILNEICGEIQKSQKDVKRLSQTVEDFIDELQEEKDNTHEENKRQQ